ncbi:Fusarubin cluster-specific transcription factor [Lachnellula hyalina]|uniref:Fusarubin cluster-specific transcription factor n=1 Tax=Lachnellula hyalina TaxID=1316788 RepID=A0A8H8TXN2_9HELO|nr:Fusarubin cluster-specific transcription factor [Lachnellula hyalina]TVY23141.1 Fusarubin cluster-specific transcription factor [Lachnellula hyalina]
MPATSTLIADLNHTPKVPKLRSSCEECGNAKVRCNPSGQPECSRCIALGLICVYGISRKFGKPPRKRGPDLDISNSFLCKKRATWTAGSCENLTIGGSEQSRDVNRSAQFSSASSVSNNPPVPSSIHAPSSIYQQEHSGPPFMTSFSVDEWPQLDIWGSLDIPPLSTSALEPATNLSRSFDTPNSHSCPRGSYELFRDLICPGPFLHAPEVSSDTVSAQLDQVLIFNRDAIDRLNRLLECPCAKSGHRVMVHASIISRILIWYQQAAGSTGCNAMAASSPSGSASSSSSPPSGATTDTDTASSPMLVQSTGFAVAQVPVSMGTFNIEDQNLQAIIRNQLVLSELKKTADLIDRFTSHNYDESSGQGVTSLYSHLGKKDIT